MSTYPVGPRLFIFVLSVVLLLPFQVEAQTSGRRGLATVIFCGLGGAVVGLSTLSFYGKPQDHTGNIYLGLGIGLIAGGAYVISQGESVAAWQPKESKPMLALSEFHKEFSKEDYSQHVKAASVQVASYTWTF